MKIQEIIKRKGNRPVYYKAVEDVDFRVDIPSRKISGYLASWGNKDVYSDILIKGCCTKSINEHGPGSNAAQKIILLYMHDMSQPMGQFTKLVEDTKGLYYEATCDALERIDEVLYQLSTGTINQHSIGFRYVWDKIEWSEDEQAYIVKEIKLYEGSVVTVGANENTPFTGFKSIEEAEQMQDELLDELEQSLKSMNRIEQYRQRQIFAKLLSINEALKADQKITLRQQQKPMSFADMAKYLKTN